MVGIVVVSHSPRLAHAAVELALEMVHGPAPASRSRLARLMIGLAPMRRGWQKPLSRPTTVPASW